MVQCLTNFEAHDMMMELKVHLHVKKRTYFGSMSFKVGGFRPHQSECRGVAPASPFSYAYDSKNLDECA